MRNKATSADHSRTTPRGRVVLPARMVRSWARTALKMAEAADAAGCDQVVYFIAPIGGGAVKIGVTQDLRRRFAAIQGCSPLPLDIISLAPGGRELESHLHTMFAGARLHGEWFEPSPELLDVSDKLAVRWIG